MRLTFARVFVIVASLVIGAAAPTAADSDEADSNAVRIRVALKEFAFVPSTITIPQRRPVIIEIVNEGRELHEFVTQAFLRHEIEVEGDGLAVAGQAIEEIEIAPGKRVELHLPAMPAGRHDVVCEAKGHLEKGMKGALVIQ
jgi:uncharacterized cupredoxin-like copper-binding protein